jgi:hypothetical protein
MAVDATLSIISDIHFSSESKYLISLFRFLASAFRAKANIYQDEGIVLRMQGEVLDIELHAARDAIAASAVDRYLNEMEKQSKSVLRAIASMTHFPPELRKKVAVGSLTWRLVTFRLVERMSSLVTVIRFDFSLIGGENVEWNVVSLIWYVLDLAWIELMQALKLSVFFFLGEHFSALLLRDVT